MLQTMEDTEGCITSEVSSGGLNYILKKDILLRMFWRKKGDNSKKKKKTKKERKRKYLTNNVIY